MEVVNRSMPPGSIIPELAYPQVGPAADWLCRVFGFRERLRIGNHRAQLVFGEGAIVVVADSSPQSHPEGEGGRGPAAGGMGHAVMVRVADVAAHYARALAEGARIIHPPTEYPFGERQYTAEDPVGRRWTFSQSVADVDPRTWGGEVREG